MDRIRRGSRTCSECGAEWDQRCSPYDPSSKSTSTKATNTTAGSLPQWLADAYAEVKGAGSTKCFEFEALCTEFLK